jgi:hypothetical protein
MKLQALIETTDLDMTEMQVKAFFLGVLCAEKPMPSSKAIEELLEEAPEAKKELEVPLKALYDQLKTNLKSELSGMFPEGLDIHSFMEVSKDQLDFFLTAMSLSGTSMESCEDEELAELIDELEDTVEDMEDYLADEDASEKDGEDFKGLLLDTWKEFVATK